MKVKDSDNQPLDATRYQFKTSFCEEVRRALGTEQAEARSKEKREFGTEGKEKVPPKHGGMFQRRTFGMALLTWVALSVVLDIPVEAHASWFHAILFNLMESFELFSLKNFLLLPGLFLLFRTIENQCREIKGGISVDIPALAFAFFMVAGYSFSKYNGMREILTVSNGQFFKTVIAFAGYTVLGTYLIRECFYLLNASRKTKHGNPAGIRTKDRGMRKHPFLCAALILTVLYIPYMVISYPGIFMGDTESQIIQAFPEIFMDGEPELLQGIMDRLREKDLIAADVFLAGDHPVAHTMLLHACISAGLNIFGSLNAGVYLFALLQQMLVIMAVAYATKGLSESGATGTREVLIILAWTFFHPQIHCHMMLLTKDVFYAAFILLFVYFCYASVAEGKCHFAGMMLSGIGVVLSRNEGRVLLILGIAALAILNRPIRKRLLTLEFCVILFSVLYFHALLPAMKVIPGSKREILSVPFQQTARYVRDYASEVTEEEKEAINAVLDYERIGKLYDPSVSDPVKSTYREDATAEELFRYFKTWFRMGLKRPGVYLQATLNNYYQYFYLKGHEVTRYTYYWSELKMDSINGYLSRLGYQLSYPPQTDGLRRFSNSFHERTDFFLPVSILAVPAIYVWTVIVAFFYGLHERDRKVISCCVIPLLMSMFFLLGPTNGGYTRYLIPLILLTPFLIIMVRGMKENGRSGTV